MLFLSILFDTLCSGRLPSMMEAVPKKVPTYTFTTNKFIEASGLV
jgi:hypothetical protein